MRTVWLFPGFMENEQIFPKLVEQLPRDIEYKYADYRPVLAEFPDDTFKIADFVPKLIVHYGILPNDVIIGHSTGGWLAAWVNHFQKNPVILLSAFTDREKVIAKGLAFRRWLRRFVVKSGLYYAGFVKSAFRKAYAHKPSRDAVFNVLLETYDSFDKDYVLKMLNIIASQEKPQYKELLRLHALKDRILAVPGEPFIEIPGDHFSLYAFPVETAKPVAEVLNKLKNTVK